MENLTEENIKTAMLGFLKGIYKYRGRNKDGSGATKTKLGGRAQDGIIVDGYLSFLDKNNKKFEATFEATSFETKEELVYLPQNDKLFWDSVATAFLFSMSCLFFVHTRGFYPILELHPALAILIGSIAILLFFFFYKWLFQIFSISRYRYIYALEQFKEYAANEQWIALGEDVFPNQEDKYYLELKKQCFKLGIGLVIINRNLKCRAVATPARHDVFQSKKKTIQFKDEETESTLHPTKVEKKKKRSFLSWLIPTETVAIYRYKKIPFHQLVITGLSFFVIISLLIVEWANGPVEYINDVEEYNKILSEQLIRNKRKKEPSYYVIDTPLEPGIFEMEKKEEFRKVEKILSTQKATDIIVADKRRQALIYYDCERFANYTGVHYIIKDTIIFGFEETVKRLKTLKKYDLEATAAWRGCLGDRRAGYVLYFNSIYQDSTLAKLDAAEIRSFFDYRTIQSSAKLIKLYIK